MDIKIKKTITWFILSVVIPVGAILVATGDLHAALGTGLFLGCAKTMVFFIHEWVWGKVIERSKPVSATKRLEARECIVTEAT